MGYFSKKKHNERQQIFLKTMLFCVIIFVVMLFLDERCCFFVDFISRYAYQISFLVLALSVYSILNGRRLYCLFFGMCFLLCLGIFSSSTNLFKNTQIEQGSVFEIDAHSTGKFSVQNARLVREGVLHFGRQHQAYFQVINSGEESITLIGVDFSQIKTQNIEKFFDSLRLFVLEQNNPVIIFGEFGIPSWFKVFRQFLNDTGLSPKNKILLKAPTQKFNLFYYPQFYVLAFTNVGLTQTEFFTETQSAKISVMIK